MHSYSGHIPSETAVQCNAGLLCGDLHDNGSTPPGPGASEDGLILHCRARIRGQVVFFDQTDTGKTQQLHRRIVRMRRVLSYALSRSSKDDAYPSTEVSVIVLALEAIWYVTAPIRLSSEDVLRYMDNVV